MTRPELDTGARAAEREAAQEGAYPRRVARLAELLSRAERLAVAFSGGVDSTVLLHAAHAALGPGAVAVIADSPSLPRAELEEARALAARIGARLVEVRTAELDDPRYAQNTGDRCYFCKHALFEAMEAWARAEGFRALAYGEITDDRRDDRPGARAASELGVLAPLSGAGLSKLDVRRYAREHGLSVADKPASACLASRIPVGTAVTAARLARVERAEAALKALGLRQLRVRDHHPRARVEVAADELSLAHGRRARLEELLAAEGYTEVELAVYRTPGGAADAGPG